MQRFETVIFDMDGTLTVPLLDFKRIREELGLDDSDDLIVQIEALPAEDRRRAWAVLDHHEKEAMEKQSLQPGTEGLIERCRTSGIRTGLLTRNVQSSVDHLCRRFDLAFDVVVTREAPVMKPDPRAVFHLLEHIEGDATESLMVGDYLYDLTCGKAAGTATCFFHNPGYPDYTEHADFTVRSMNELETIIFGAS